MAELSERELQQYSLTDHQWGIIRSLPHFEWDPSNTPGARVPPSNPSSCAHYGRCTTGPLLPDQ
eukprot:9470606-Pyramimonas_sp.AAC.1